MVIERFKNKGIGVFKSEVNGNGETLEPPFSEFFVFKACINTTCQRLGSNEANALIYLIDEFRGNARPRTLPVARGEFEQLPLEKSTANDDRPRNLCTCRPAGIGQIFVRPD